MDLKKKKNIVHNFDANEVLYNDALGGGRCEWDARCTRCVFVCMCVCACVCVHVCMCVYMYVYTCVCRYMLCCTHLVPPVPEWAPLTGCVHVGQLGAGGPGHHRTWTRWHGTQCSTVLQHRLQ